MWPSTFEALQWPPFSFAAGEKANILCTVIYPMWTLTNKALLWPFEELGLFSHSMASLCHVKSPSSLKPTPQLQVQYHVPPHCQLSR
ncbi:hypothetical protein V6N13_141972 [Hibiscus sabdariffa]|uniref:Uncharacterized protein n=1 Tax=Hibiscus sabdariffa TaxID=183260 RepID=A0ABR2FCN6_9ROSI